MYVAARRKEIAAALAAAFLGGRWSEDAMVRRGASVLDPRPRWLRAVVREVLAAYHRQPADRPRELAAYVALALEERRTSLPPPRVRRWIAYEPAMARTRWPVPEIASPGALAEALGLDAGALMWLADARGLERTAGDERLRHYRYLWLQRLAAPPRPIARPKQRLKAVQRWILHEILDRIPDHDAAHGFVPGRSARSHAALHAGSATVVRLDLEDFFASVPAARVYADDLTFSGPADLPAGTLARVTGEIAREEGFRVAPGKTRVRRRHERQLVAGLVVNERPNVARTEYDRLKAVLHDARRNGPAAANRAGHPEFRAHLLGRIAWVSSVSPRRGRRLRERFDALPW